MLKTSINQSNGSSYRLLAYELSNNTATEVFTIKTKNSHVLSTIYNNIIDESYVMAIKPLSHYLSVHKCLGAVEVYYMIDNTVIYTSTVPRIQAVAALFCELEYLHNNTLIITKNNVLKISDFKRMIQPKESVRRFKVEPYHVTLYNNLQINWKNALNSEPILNKNIPYKTTDIANDIAEILNFSFFEKNNMAKSKNLTNPQKDLALKIHSEMTQVLEIFNSSTSFEEGIYEFDEDTNKWFKLSEVFVS